MHDALRHGLVQEAIVFLARAKALFYLLLFRNIHHDNEARPSRRTCSPGKLHIAGIDGHIRRNTPQRFLERRQRQRLDEDLQPAADEGRTLDPQQGSPGQVRLKDLPIAIDGEISDRGEIVELG